MPYHNKEIYNGRTFHIFDKVNCSTFYVKYYDHKYIANENDTSISGKKKITEQFTIIDGIDENGEEIRRTPSYEGSYELEKQYYRLKSQSFSGIIVGFNDIVITAFLGTDHADNGYNEYDYVFKEPHEVVKCAKVCYGNNKFRFVPLENILLLDD